MLVNPLKLKKRDCFSKRARKVVQILQSSYQNVIIYQSRNLQLNSIYDLFRLKFKEQKIPQTSRRNYLISCSTSRGRIIKF